MLSKLIPYFLLSFTILTSTFEAAQVNPPKQNYDFSNLYHTEVDKTFYPKTSVEVQAIVQQAIQQNKKIATAGSKMSQGGHSLPSTEDSYLINSKLMNKVEILPTEKIARVGPGATWLHIQNAANEHGLAVKVMQASNIFSIGGSLSTNVHGWDHQQGALVETVRSITIVDGQGNIKQLKPGDEQFSLVIGGYGMFGIIVEAELELADDDIVERQGLRIQTSEYFNYFTQTIENNPDIILHYARLSLDPSVLFEEVIAVDYVKTSKTHTRPKKLPQEPANGHWYERIAINVLRQNPAMIALKQIYDNKTFLTSKVMSRNEAMLPSVRFVFDSNKQDADMLQEFFIPKHQLYPFLQQLRTIIERYDVNLFNATIRHVKQDTITAMPYAKTDVFAVVIYYNESLDKENLTHIKQFTQETVDNAIQFGGTYYLPYHRFPSLDQLKQAYPEYSYIKEKRLEYDPLQLFSTQFSEEYF